MSYSVNIPCYNCKKRESEKPCKDYEKIQSAVNLIHISDDETHQGSGTVLLSCIRIDSNYK